MAILKLLKIPRPSIPVKATQKGIYNVIQRTSIRKNEKIIPVKKEWLKLLMVFSKHRKANI